MFAVAAWSRRQARHRRHRCVQRRGAKKTPAGVAGGRGC